MKKLLLICSIFLLGSQFSNAQLSIGDIAFIGYNTTAPDAFTFIALKDIPATEVIYFTDQGWDSGWYPNTEDHLIYTPPAGGLSCGTVVHIEESTSDIFTVNGGGSIVFAVGYSGWSLIAGDQIIAYQGTAAAPPAPTFIAAIHGDYDLANHDPVTGWNFFIAGSSGESTIPPGMTQGIDCVSPNMLVGIEYDNLMYTGSLTGTAATVRAEINNAANWDQDLSQFTPYNITPAAYSPSVTCTAPCTDPNVPTVIASPSSICPGASSTLNISGSLNDATAWHIYTGSCGGTQIGTTATSSFVVSPSVTTTYYIRGEDGAGCVDESTGICGQVTVTVSNATPPTAVCQNITVFLDGTGNATITAGDIDNGSTDNCGAVTLSASQTSFTCADIGANNVTLTVTDGNSNSSNCTATVTVSDTISPTAVCQNITVYLDGTGNATITAGDIDNGSTDNCGAVTLSASQTSFTCADIGVNNVTLTVTDGNSNSSNCTATVTVSDTISPTAVCQNITVYLDGTGNATITAADIDNGSTDNCGAVTLSASQTSFTCADIGVNNVTLTVTDGNSNSSNCTATVTVSDTISPTAVCQNITVYLDGTGNATITAADIDNGSTDNCGAVTLSASQTSFTCADIGVNNVTLTVTDGNSNSSNCTATVTVSDTISPTAVCQNITVYLDGTGNATITAADIDNGSTDNCGAVTLSASQTSFTCADIGVNNVTLTVTDGNSNSSNCTATVTVSDTISPTAVCQNITVYLDGTGNATITAGDIDNGSTDNCGAVTLSASQTSFTCADIGVNNVTLTVTDGNSNANNCLAVVTVADTTSPAITCPGNQTGSTNASCQFTIPDYTGLATASDNCGTPTVTQSPVPGTIVGSGTTIITLIATDGSSNTTQCTFDVVVNSSITGIDVVTNCNSFIWIDGNTYTASNNTATFNIVGGSANGCDSLVALDLTIISVTDLTTSTVGGTISSNNSFATYQWLDCDNSYALISGETGISFTPSANGNYAVELTENGCIDTTSCVAITTVGIIENSFGVNLQVYPNPTSGNFSIDLGSIYQKSEVLITDLSGKVINAKSVSQSKVLNLSIEEPAGIYIIYIQAGKQRAVIRLVKE